MQLRRHFSRNDKQVTNNVPHRSLGWKSNQGHNEIQVHIHQDGCHKKDIKKCWQGCLDVGILLLCWQKYKVM